MFTESTDGILSIDINKHEIVAGSADCSYRIYNIRDGMARIVFLLNTSSFKFSVFLLKLNSFFFKLYHIPNNPIISLYKNKNKKFYYLEFLMAFIKIQMYVDFLGEAVTSVHFTPDSNCILATTQNSHLRMMDKSNGKMLVE